MLKKRGKLILTMGLVATMSMSLIACGSSDTAKKEEKPKAVASQKAEDKDKIKESKEDKKQEEKEAKEVAKKKETTKSENKSSSQVASNKKTTIKAQNKSSSKAKAPAKKAAPKKTTPKKKPVATNKKPNNSSSQTNKKPAKPKVCNHDGIKPAYGGFTNSDLQIEDWSFEALDKGIWTGGNYGVNWCPHCDKMYISYFN